jgi:3-oxoadipate enol-lactonase
MKTPFLTLALCVLALAGARPAAAETGFVTVPGGKLAYETCGTGPQTLVLLHDGVVDSSVWDGVWPTLCERFHVLRYDRRGYGRSPLPTDWYSETDDLAELMSQVKLGHAVLVASSHGGGVALDFAIQHPQAVDQLVLVGAEISGLNHSEHFARRGVAMAEPLYRNDLSGFVNNVVADRYLIAPGHTAAQARLRAILTANPPNMARLNYMLTPKPALSLAGEVRAPTLILTGDADIADVHAQAGALEAAIPRATRIVLKDCGHLMYLEHPEAFCATVMRFIASNSL